MNINVSIRCYSQETWSNYLKQKSRYCYIHANFQRPCCPITTRNYQATADLRRWSIFYRRTAVGRKNFYLHNLRYWKVLIKYINIFRTHYTWFFIYRYANILSRSSSGRRSNLRPLLKLNKDKFVRRMRSNLWKVWRWHLCVIKCRIVSRK